jgi:hypothetical protein
MIPSAVGVVNVDGSLMASYKEDSILLPIFLTSPAKLKDCTWTPKDYLPCKFHRENGFLHDEENEDYWRP